MSNNTTTTTTEKKNLKEITFPHEQFISENKITISKLPKEIITAINEFKNLRNHLNFYSSNPEKFNERIDKLQVFSSEITEEISQYWEEVGEKGKTEPINQNTTPPPPPPPQNEKVHKKKEKSGSIGVLLGFVGITLAAITGFQIFNSIKKNGDN